MSALALTLSGLNAALSKVSFQPELEQKANEILRDVAIEAEFDDVSINAEILTISQNEVRLDIDQGDRASGRPQDTKRCKILEEVVERGLNQ